MCMRVRACVSMCLCVCVCLWIFVMSHTYPLKITYSWACCSDSQYAIWTWTKFIFSCFLFLMVLLLDCKRNLTTLGQQHAALWSFSVTHLHRLNKGRGWGKLIRVRDEDHVVFRVDNFYRHCFWCIRRRCFCCRSCFCFLTCFVVCSRSRGELSQILRCQRHSVLTRSTLRFSCS